MYRPFCKAHRDTVPQSSAECCRMHLRAIKGIRRYIQPLQGSLAAKRGSTVMVQQAGQHGVGLDRVRELIGLLLAARHEGIGVPPISSDSMVMTTHLLMLQAMNVQPNTTVDHSRDNRAKSMKANGVCQWAWLH